MVGPDGEYCLSVGFTDGRTICPIRPEGADGPTGLRAVEVGHRQGHRPARAHVDRHPQGRHDQLLHGAHGTVRAPPGRSVLGEGVQGRPLPGLHRGRGVRPRWTWTGACDEGGPGRTGGAAAGRRDGRGRARRRHRGDRRPIVQGDLGHKLDEYLSRLEALGYSGGLAVVKGGETVLLKGYGQADRERGVPMGPDSVFNLGSITKPFTAAAILRLQELGKLKTSDPVSRFFDGVPADKAGITLEHLLTHSSGPRVGLQPHRLRGDDPRGVRPARARLEAPLPPGPGLRVRERGLQPARRRHREDDRQGLRDGPRRARPEAGGHDRDRLQGPAVGRGPRRPRLPRRRGLGHDPRSHRGARRALLGAARQRGAAHDARRHGALGRGAAGPSRPHRGLPRELLPPARGRGPGGRARTTPSAGRSRRRRTARSCSTTAATGSTWPSSCASWTRA